MQESICLIGFMGSGKTTVGRELAKKLGYEWLDLDVYIEEKAGMRIAQLFKEKGEAYFRSLEAACLKEVLSQKQHVISTGGGVIVTPENVECLKKQQTFFLDYSIETLYQRIKGDETRPLVSGFDELKARLEGRKPFYEAAARHILWCEGMTVNEITEKIKKAL